MAARRLPFGAQVFLGMAIGGALGALARSGLPDPGIANGIAETLRIIAVSILGPRLPPD